MTHRVRVPGLARIALIAILLTGCVADVEARTVVGSGSRHVGSNVALEPAGGFTCEVMDMTAVPVTTARLSGPLP